MTIAATVARVRSLVPGAVAATAALLLCSTAASLDAQGTSPDRLSFWLGAGGALPLSQPTIERKTGPTALAGLELAMTPRLSLRAELSGNTQDLSTRADGPLSGDIQQARASLAARFTPITLGRVAPYVLAGAGWFWQSDRIVLTDISNPVPDAAYRQTSSRNTVGALVGAGATAPVGRLRLFGEARWTRAGSSDPVTDLSILAGVALPLGR